MHIWDISQIQDKNTNISQYLANALFALLVPCEVKTSLSGSQSEKRESRAAAIPIKMQMNRKKSL